jgi:choline kinase
MSYHAIIPAAGLGRRLGGSDRPKCLQEVAGSPLLLHALAAMSTRGVERVTLIVGHGQAQIRSSVGTEFAGMPVDYVVNADFATTEHGYSLYLAAAAWRAHPAHVLFMDADNAFDPRLLDRLLASERIDTLLVDPALDSSAREEELVLGRDGRVSGLVRGHAAAHADCVGGFVGMNRFGADFTARLFAFLDDFFARHDRRYKYERLFDRLLRSEDVVLHYLDTGALAWVNVNHVEDVATAARILRTPESD